MDAPLRIAIADDHALFRQGLKALVDLHALGTVVAEADRAEDVQPMLERTPCDVLLLDLRMDRNALGDIPALAARVKVIVVTASENPEEGLYAIRAGARAVVLKHVAFETLVDAVRAVAAGDVWMPPSLQSRVVEGFRDDSATALTPREREIVRHVALGLRNAEVATRLLISEDTVKKHLSHVFTKLGLRDRVELTRYALRLGLVGLGERPRDRTS